MMTAAHQRAFLRGSKGIPETQQFATSFPLSAASGKSRILTTDQFDIWAEDHGYYSTDCESATLLADRNNLRKKINVTASSEAWTSLNNIAFSIDVYDHGKSYKVQRAEDSFSVKANRLPAQVKSYAGTKRDRIQRLLNSIDLGQLPPAMQMRIGSLDREVERYLRGIDYQTSELNREYEAIRLQIQQMVDQKMIVVENGGFTELLEIEHDNDDDDDDSEDGE